MKKAYIIISSLAACIILYLLEQVIAVDYLTKTIAKLILFIAIPYIYIKLVNYNMMLTLTLRKGVRSSCKEVL